MEQRKGIVCAGNWIVDHVKVVDKFPEENMLVNILEVYKSVGGGPNNVLTDLKCLNVDIPLFAAGIVGEDGDGDYILSQLKDYGINHDFIEISNAKPTSFTDAMTVKSNGNRTFFHYRGANALLGVEQLSKIDLKAKIFHLAYLLLLDELDSPDEEYFVKAARLLKLIKEKGYKTSIDVVSEDGGRMEKIVRPCLPYIDYLIINEIEAGFISGKKIRKESIIDFGAMESAAEFLMKEGVQEKVIIHCPEGAFLIDNNGNKLWTPSWLVDNDEIKGATGAGDAFCAGCLYGIHENMEHERILQLGHASARFNLLDPTSVGGAVTLKEIEKFMESAEMKI